MEGMGGKLVLFCEFLREDPDEVRFPGYEIVY